MCCVRLAAAIFSLPQNQTIFFQIFSSVLRLKIECHFGSFKGLGFNFEDTHLTDQIRIKAMLSLRTITFLWAHRKEE
jgi:hypothetical protein